MNKLINSLTLSVFCIITFNQFCDDSEFIIPKKVDLGKNDSSAKIKEKIVRTSGDVLKLDTKLTKLSIEIRELLLDEIESCLENSKDNFVGNASKQELKNVLNELDAFKNKLEENIKIIEKNLTSLQKKFCSR